MLALLLKYILKGSGNYSKWLKFDARQLESYFSDIMED